MMSNDLLRFAEMGTRASVLDLKIKNKQLDIRDEKDSAKLFDLSVELIHLVEEKTQLLVGLFQFTQEKFKK